MSSEDFNCRVRVLSQRYVSDDQSFAVVEAALEDGDTVTLRGPVGHLQIDSEAIVKGRVEDHPRFGVQIAVNSALQADPEENSGQLRYLQSIEKIGKQRAQRLLKHYGESVFEQIDQDPVTALLRAIPKMGRNSARIAAEDWQQRRQERELATLLAEHGLLRLLPRLNDLYGEQAYAVLSRNPYLLTQLHGVSFRTADLIARSIDNYSDGPQRTNAALLHVLDQAHTQGHTFLPMKIADNRAQELLKRPTAFDHQLGEPELQLIQPEDRLYSQRMLISEQQTAHLITALVNSQPTLKPPSSLREAEQLTQQQLDAVNAAFQRRISLVTGGPGTGKSTLTRAVVKTANSESVSVKLAAPTGRAARRLSELTEQDATTVHRLLEWQPGSGPARGAEDPVECDLLIVDECSMLTLRMAQLLLAAVGPKTHIVLIGDADQLPPVGAGRPFAELIESGAAHCTELDHVFRQAARSMIVRAAHEINRGNEPIFDPQAGEADMIQNLFWVERNGEEVSREVVSLVKQRLPAHYSLDPVKDIQVLAPIYRGTAGIDLLNQQLSAALNPTGEQTPIAAIKVGDKLIQTRNSYEHDLMNGQIIYLRNYDRIKRTLNVTTDDGRSLSLPQSAAEDLKPAYAISVHKSQGCEVPVVVFVVNSSASILLSRNLIYTAITRAKLACVVVGNYEIFKRALSREESSGRYSALAERIQAAEANPTEPIKPANPTQLPID